MKRTMMFSLTLMLAACGGGSNDTGPFTADDSQATAADGKEDSARSSRERKPELPTPSVVDDASVITMSDALRSVADHGPAIEAKYELDDAGALSLSIYPTGKGIDVNAGDNVFQELSGAPKAGAFTPALETFSDQEHLTRSARDLTLVQLSQTTLLDAVDLAETYGRAYWAVPAISGKRPGYNVYVLRHGRSYYGFIDGGAASDSYVEEAGDGPGAAATDPRTPELADLKVLRSAKISLSQALKKSEAKYGRTIEAKFEDGDDGKLSLSIYPVKSATTINAEKAVFQELSGDPTASTWAPSLETFAGDDAEHLTRSARDLTLVQTANLTLLSAVQTAESLYDGGLVYWAIPTIRDGHAGYGVYVLGSDDQVHYLFIC